MATMVSLVTALSLDTPGYSTLLLIRIIQVSARKSVQTNACLSPGAGDIPGHLMTLQEVFAISFMS